MLVLRVVLCNTLFAVYDPCCAVYHSWELSYGHPADVVRNTVLWYDRITGHETNLVFIISIAVNSVLWEPSVGSY